MLVPRLFMRVNLRIYVYIISGPQEVKKQCRRACHIILLHVKKGRGNNPFLLGGVLFVRKASRTGFATSTYNSRNRERESKDFQCFPELWIRKDL